MCHNSWHIYIYIYLECSNFLEVLVALLLRVGRHRRQMHLGLNCSLRLVQFNIISFLYVFVYGGGF